MSYTLLPTKEKKSKTKMIVISFYHNGYESTDTDYYSLLGEIRDTIGNCNITNWDSEEYSGDINIKTNKSKHQLLSELKSSTYLDDWEFE